MIVGVARVDLDIPENDSLKGKRSVVKPLVLKVMNKFKLHAAEVDQLDAHQSATIGLTLCGNDQRHVNTVLSKAVDWIEHSQFEANVTDIEMEFLNVL
jgi:uncharacterized protein YlxP (DUF503 family)